MVKQEFDKTEFGLSEDMLDLFRTMDENIGRASETRIIAKLQQLRSIPSGGLVFTHVNAETDPEKPQRMVPDLTLYRPGTIRHQVTMTAEGPDPTRVRVPIEEYPGLESIAIDAINSEVRKQEPESVTSARIKRIEDPLLQIYLKNYLNKLF